MKKSQSYLCGLGGSMLQDFTEHDRAHFSTKKQPVRFFVILFLSILFLSACSVAESVDFDLGSKTAYHADSRVVRGEPDIYVYPVTEVGNIKVLFVPFKVVQKIDNPEMIGYSLAKGFWNTWSGMRVFDQFEFAADTGPFRRDLAVAYARARGADMVVGGFVTHIFAGGNSSANRLTLQIEAYDVSSGLLVWSMAHGGSIPAPKNRDFIILDVKTKQPVDPMQLINSTLAVDMGKIMQEWNRGGETTQP
ncbi:hypothetical protein LJB93_03355 [Desulfovibrio sp. OttesenSCG-928-F07]|nr:hypothetical protein [Desulfovibrio sp. OttesenSCG-928-F07]